MKSTTKLSGATFFAPSLLLLLPYNSVRTALLALRSLLHYRADSNALDNYLDVPSPLTEDTTITLSVGVIECPALDANTNALELEEIIVEGGTLTIASDNTVH